MNLRLEIDNILSRFPSKRIRNELGDSSFLSLFDSELAYMNFVRLRYLSYFGIALSIFLLYTDFYLDGFWSDFQMNSYIILDFICTLTTLLIFFVTHINVPKAKENIKFFHKLVVSFSLIYYVCWCAAVSSIEYITSEGFPTYLIGVFSASILFLYRKGTLLFANTLSALTLVFLLLIKGVSFHEILQEFYSVLALLILAFVISRLLLITRVNSFIATIKLELFNTYLDSVVRERTMKLLDSNKLLNLEIIERKRHEEELLKEKKRAEEADRLKTVFLGNISHEIRTPLNGILGFGELLINQLHNPEKTKKYIGIINSNSRQLLGIIEDIIDISVIEANQLVFSYSNFNVEVILDAVYTEIKNYCIEKHVKNIKLVKAENDNKEIYIYSDYLRVQQVLTKILINAIKFTNKGTVTFGCQQKETEALFYVEDSGIGLNEKQAMFIFAPFRQVDESATRTSGGNGLGLAISKGIVNKLGGRIWHDTNYTKGARFYFTIPLKLE